MDKKKFTYLLAAAFVILCCNRIHANAQNFWIGNDTAAHNLVWEEKLRKRIDFLSDSLCAGRATGTAGGNEAAFWLVGRFRSAGLMPFGNTYAKHLYAGNGTVGHNIIGMLPGSRTKPCDSYIIIGAHYDHLGVLGGKMYPGADNNASGVAALLSLADMFSTMKDVGRVYGKSIIFVAFDAKEMNMAGSESLWRMIENGELADPVSGRPVTPEKIYAMANMEQIGSSLAPLSSGRKELNENSLSSFFDFSLLSLIRVSASAISLFSFAMRRAFSSFSCISFSFRSLLTVESCFSVSDISCFVRRESADILCALSREFFRSRISC